MTRPLWINRGEPYWAALNIARCEEKYNATYVGDFCINLRRDPGAIEWSENAFAVFFQENPPKPEHGQYFGLYCRRDGGVWITGASSVAEGHWYGIVADSGEIIYSRWRHDFRQSQDGSVTVDGGRDYFKVLSAAHNPTVRITVVRDQLIVNDSLILPYASPDNG